MEKRTFTIHKRFWFLFEYKLEVEEVFLLPVYSESVDQNVDLIQKSKETTLKEWLNNKLILFFKSNEYMINERKLHKTFIKVCIQ